MYKVMYGNTEGTYIECDTLEDAEHLAEELTEEFFFVEIYDNKWNSLGSYLNPLHNPTKRYYL